MLDRDVCSTDLAARSNERIVVGPARLKQRGPRGSCRRWRLYALDADGLWNEVSGIYEGDVAGALRRCTEESSSTGEPVNAEPLEDLHDGRAIPLADLGSWTSFRPAYQRLRPRDLQWRDDSETRDVPA